MRVVLDTNILVRAFIKPLGAAAPVLTYLRTGAYTLVSSQPLLSELLDVLNRPRIADKYGLRDQEIQALQTLIAVWGERVIPQRRISLCRDPDDDKVLKAAVAGSADLIVSGDKDLLVLDPFEGIRIVDLGTFLAMVGEARPESVEG